MKRVKDQKQIMRVVNIEREARGLEEDLQFVDSQIAELENFKEDILNFSLLEDEEMLSSSGKRGYIKNKKSGVYLNLRDLKFINSF